MKSCCALLLTLLPFTAFAYPIEVEKHLAGTGISFTTDDTAGDMGAITLRNDGPQAAQCTVEFRNGPEAPRVRRASVEPGKSATVLQRFNRDILKLRLKVTCEAS
ncbi:3-phosphoglycerate kinase [Pseudomonas eucalypticola]|uniref:3-phosphoglycerate kinase n=1 Tax=Pseudomonas eucalypticola TaxID=2599595 RepID=A0A7D5HBV7_9PSED|nr:3-phosphoglycerate kinase [Pseudomonas eucalypticola]QKZ03450.1 3-phosphoglycerate kinase [Pseudomonas eucalypticola]